MPIITKSCPTQNCHGDVEFDVPIRHAKWSPVRGNCPVCKRDADYTPGSGSVSPSNPFA